MKILKSPIGLAFLLASAMPAYAQYIPGGGGTAGGGSGTVSNVATGAGLTGGPITTTGTISMTQLLGNSGAPITGASYAVDCTTDAATELLFTGASASAWTLAAPSGACGAGLAFGINNRGTDDITLTVTGNINGSATKTFTPGQGSYIYNDGSTWYSNDGAASGGSGTPGGSTTQVQYNNAGAFGGISGATTDGTTLTLVAPVLGTPASGTLTNTTGFPVSGLAGAGSGILTWLATPSSANLATALTDETGSGVAVFATSPTLVTPTIGVANGTSLALGVCTIGSSSLCTAGNIAGLGNITAGASSQLGIQGRGFFVSAGAGFLQMGASSSTPVAQNLTVANGTGTNIAGATTTIQGSVATGNANSGDLNFQVGGAVGASGSTLATPIIALKLRGVSGLVQLPQLSTDATHTTRTVCQDTTSFDLYFGSGTAGICLGTSSARYKHDIAPLSMGLSQIMALKPVSYRLNKDKGDPNKTLYGFLAEDMEKVTPTLVGHDKQGRADTADYVGVIPILVKAVQEQQHEIAALKKQIGVRR